MSAAGIPTLVDVSLLQGGSPRVVDGQRTRSIAMKVGFLDAVNQAVRDYEAASAAASRAEGGYDGWSAMDVAFRIVAARLNDVAIRAAELDDPVLLTIMASLGMHDDGTVRLVDLGDGGGDARPMAGLGPTLDEVPPATLASIAADVRRGVHHADGWTLETTAATQSDQTALDAIADALDAGLAASEDGSPPWRVLVRA